MTSREARTARRAAAEERRPNSPARLQRLKLGSFRKTPPLPPSPLGSFRKTSRAAARKSTALTPPTRAAHPPPRASWLRLVIPSNTGSPPANSSFQAKTAPPSKPSCATRNSYPLYLRYQTAHDRASYKALHALIPLRRGWARPAPTARQHIGFVSQNDTSARAHPEIVPQNAPILRPERGFVSQTEPRVRFANDADQANRPAETGSVSQNGPQEPFDPDETLSKAA